MRIRRSASRATTVASSVPGGSRSSRCSPAATPSTRQSGSRACERRDQPVAAFAVLAAGAPEMAVDLAGGEQPGVGAGGIAGPPESTAQRSRAISAASVRRGDEPPEPQRRRERLRRRAEVDDAVGREPLQRPDRRAVIAVLGVVVVLDHDPAPREQRAPPLGREHGAGRELVRRA